MNDTTPAERADRGDGDRLLKARFLHHLEKVDEAIENLRQAVEQIKREEGLE